MNRGARLFPIALKLDDLSPERRALLRQLLGGADTSVPIAVVGMACRFPGADSVNAYWDLLANGRDAVTEIPRDRWNPDDLGPGVSRWGGFLSDIDKFDAGFFGISPSEAEALDPQQRLVLETAWEAFEDANVRPRGSRTGVYLGILNHDYSILAANPEAERSPFLATGTAQSVAAGRLAYFFDLHGPAMAIDTASSSSLVAIHLARQSLILGDCELALAGGVNCILSPHATIMVSRAGLQSPRGRCRAFDQSADGYVRGEGVGLLVLKRLDRALLDGNVVHAVIRGSAINQDGATNGITAPSRRAQVDLLRAAYTQAQISIRDAQYFEAHGTGTPLGDPVELGALGEMIAESDGPAGFERAITSTKSSIGHLESAAGMAGIIRVILSMKNRAIAPTLHVETLNPQVPWDAVGIKPRVNLGEWPRPDLPLIAGVSSFGIGGTNAHVVLGEAPALDQRRYAESDALVSSRVRLPLVISAKSEQALEALVDRFIEFFGVPNRQEQTYRDVSATSLRREWLEHRLVVLGESASEWQAHCRSYRVGSGERGAVKGRATATRIAPAFVFPGQGSQWVGMGTVLYHRSAVFRRHIDACADAFRSYVDWNLVDEIFAPKETSRLAEIDVVQPMLFALQTGLAALYASEQIVPVVTIGHSMGEVAAAYVSGVLSLEHAAKVICVRSRLLKTVRGRGAMAVVERSMADALSDIAPLAGRVSIGANNGPRTTVLSGDPTDLAHLLTKYQAEGVFARLVNVDVASHSAQVDELREALLRELSDVKGNSRGTTFRSTVFDQEPPDGLELDAHYWWKNLREPVHLAATVGRTIGAGVDFLFELSPHPILVPALQETVRDLASGTPAIGTLRRDEPDDFVFDDACARWLAFGGSVIPRGWNEPGIETRRVPLPSYAWERTRYWISKPRAGSYSERATEWATPTRPSGRARTRIGVDAVTQQIRGFLSRHLSRLPAVVDPDAPLKNYGADSLTFTALRDDIESAFDFRVTTGTLFATGTLRGIATLVVSFVSESPTMRINVTADLRAALAANVPPVSEPPRSKEESKALLDAELAELDL